MFDIICIVFQAVTGSLAESDFYLSFSFSFSSSILNALVFVISFNFDFDEFIEKRAGGFYAQFVFIYELEKLYISSYSSHHVRKFTRQA